MRRQLARSFVGAQVGASASSSSLAPSASGDGRRLVVNGSPFLIRGDTPWELVKKSPTDVAQYLDDRQTRGFNSIIIEGPISPDFVPVNYNGDPAFNANLGGGSVDFSTPNSNWFGRVAAVISAARDRGMICFYFPLYLGFAGGSEGFYQDAVDNGATATKNFGQYTGSLLNPYENVVVVLGGDYVPDSTGLALIKNVADGLKLTDRANRLWSWHCGPNVQSYELDSTTAGYRASIAAAPNFCNFEYSYEASFGNEFSSFNAANCYSSSPTTPLWLGEAHYELSSFANADATLLRRQSWSVNLYGGAGTFFGNETLYPFATGWQAQLGSTGTQHEVLMHQFLAARRWDLLVPSTGSAFVSSGGGTSNTLGFKSRSIASDGSWGAVYVSDGSSTTLDFSGFSGSCHIWWLDPTTGASQAATPATHTNSGTQAFSTPGNNAAGQVDWVLYVTVP